MVSYDVGSGNQLHKCIIIANCNNFHQLGYINVYAISTVHLLTHFGWNKLKNIDLWTISIIYYAKWLLLYEKK